MTSKAESLRKAEAFVRRALSESSGKPADERIVRQVAEKVSKAVPPYELEGVR
jgi:hypothetical protein